MDKKIAWIILVICVILLCVCTWSYFKYTYHERDESYVALNGIYIKCVPNGSEAVVCTIPGQRTIQITKLVSFNSTLK